MEWSHSELDFGTIQVGGRSPAQSAYLYNTGQVPIVVTAIESDTEFDAIDTAPTYNTVAPNSGKYFRLAYTPTTAGDRIGTLTVRTAPPGGTYSLPMKGTGKPRP
jgi:hypothetical protein